MASGELHGCLPDPTRSAEHQHGLTGCQPCPLAQREPSGVVDQAQRRRFRKGHARRQAIALVGAERDKLGIAALFGHCQHGVADLRCVDTRSQRRHHAGRPLAGDKRARREELVGAADDQQVDVIDRRHMHLDQHLAGSRVW